MSIRMALDATCQPPPLADRMTGLAAFTLAIALLRLLPLRATLTATRLTSRLTHHPATEAEALRAAAARTWAARWFPGRAACLEISLAAYLAAALRGRRVSWCIGCRFHPAESHAWIEAAGHPIGEPTRGDRAFQVAVRI